MGYNRSGHTRLKRLRRRKKHMLQLARKAARDDAKPMDKPPAKG